MNNIIINKNGSFFGDHYCVPTEITRKLAHRIEGVRERMYKDRKWLTGIRLGEFKRIWGLL